MTAADRQRRHRLRRASGRTVLQVDVAFLDLADALVQGGWLKQWDADDRGAVEKALGVFLEYMARGRNA